MRKGALFCGYLLSALLMMGNVQPVPQSSSYPLRSVYRIADIGKPQMPSLNTAQLSWVRKVLANSYWKLRIKHLWFAFVDEKPQDPPLIFYVENGVPGNSYQIVGLGCFSLFMRDSAMFEIGDVPTEGIGLCYHDPFADQSIEKQILPHPVPAPPDQSSQNKSKRP